MTQPKCSRLVVMAVYADGTSYVVDIKDPVTCDLDFVENNGMDEVSMQNYVALRTESPRFIVDVKVNKLEPVIVSCYPTPRHT